MRPRVVAADMRDSIAGSLLRSLVPRSSAVQDGGVLGDGNDARYGVCRARERYSIHSKPELARGWSSPTHDSALAC